VQLVSENVLQVSGVRPGNRTPTAVAASGRWHVKERPTGAFRRTFQLPPDVSVRSASDVYAVDIDGVLVIKVPKRPLVRTIPVY
jgi:HSP20 family molecular chaperone IbpA